MKGSGVKYLLPFWVVPTLLGSSHCAKDHHKTHDFVDVSVGVVVIRGGTDVKVKEILPYGEDSYSPRFIIQHRKVGGHRYFLISL